MRTVYLSLIMLFSMAMLQGLSGADISRTTPAQMRLPLTEEISGAPEEILDALRAYHDSRHYQQTPEDFFNAPKKYINTRIDALENLLLVIDGCPEWKKLRQKARKKLAYLNALPNMLHPKATRLELAPMSLSAEQVGVKDTYWFEYLDPLHRIGPEVKVHIDSWMATDIPNYFVFLETVEYDPLLNQFSPFTHQVVYYGSDEERLPHKINFKEGLCFRGDKPFDTGNSFSYSSDEPGLALFTIGLDEEMYVNSHVKYKIHHSSEFAGGEVISAGELRAESGVITELTNKSGHYSPKQREVMAMLRILKRKLGTLKGINLILFQYTKTGEKYHKQFVTYDAEDYLEKKGLTPALSATGGWNAVHAAVWNGHFSLADEVMLGTDLEAKDFQGNTPLHLAVAQGYVDWTVKLLDADVSLTTQNFKGETPLHIASLSGDEMIAKLLISQMDYVDVRNEKEQTPLHYAAMAGSKPIYDMLVAKGASPKAYDEDGNHLLHFAVYKGNAPFLKELLKTDQLEQLFTANRRKASVLHSAAAFGDEKTLEIILDFGLDLLKKDYKGRTPLHYAAKFGNVETTSALLRLNNPALLNARTHRSLTAFHYAAESLPLDSIKEFISYGAKINAVDYKGRSALFYAINGGKSSIALRNLKYLACHGAHTHLFSTGGQAPIHYAASRGSISALRRLLSSSNDLFLRDSQGRTALDIARHKNYPMMIQYLSEHSR